MIYRMATDFITIDLETANADVRSICQIGMVRYRNGVPDWEWMSYINPKTAFDPMNVGIHGITSAKVRRSPSLTDVGGRLREMLNGEIVISHTHFDRSALDKAFDGHDIPRLSCHWLDSAMIARRAWSGLQQEGGYSLANLCGILGYRYQRHDALADARAAGVVVLTAIEQTGVELNQWLHLVKRPVKEGPQVLIRTLPEPVVAPEMNLAATADGNARSSELRRNLESAKSDSQWERFRKRLAKHLSRR